MTIQTGCLYFVSDEFFSKINDPFLKTNYPTTKRPHYFSVLDKKTNLLWLVPCSSKVEKFEKIIKDKQSHNKPTDTIKIVKIWGKKSVLLFQDMFPIIPKYIDSQYLKNGKTVKINDPKIVHELENNAVKIIKLLHRGIRFTPTQPDILKIEQIMLKELSINSKGTLENISSLQKRRNKYITSLNNISAFIHYEEQYYANRKVYLEYIKLPDYRQEKFFLAHQNELVKFADANTAIRKEVQKAGLNAMPKLESLKAQKQMLSEEIERLEDQIADEKQKYEELRNVEKNAAAMMGAQEQPAYSHKAVLRDDLTL